VAVSYWATFRATPFLRSVTAQDDEERRCVKGGLRRRAHNSKRRGAGARAAKLAVGDFNQGKSVITMTSLEIAKLTGKDHKHVLADISNMLNKLG